MNFTKETCPVCKRQFIDSDDVVVCPVCGTPHHRECYDECGHCFNEARHAEGFEWAGDEGNTYNFPAFNRIPKGSSSVPGVTVCPVCHTQNPSEEPVCLNCGARLYNNAEAPTHTPDKIPPFPPQGQPMPGIPNVVSILPTDTIGGHTVQDTADYIQSNADSYIPKFYRLEKTGGKISMNWCAFLFAPYWFFYRKMVSIGIIIMLLSLVVSAACTTQRVIDIYQVYSQKVEAMMQNEATAEDVNEVADELLKLPEVYIEVCFQGFVHLLCGLYANSIYKKKVEKDIGEIKATSASPEDYRQRLFLKGGVSGLALAGSLFAFLFASELVSYLVTLIK